MQLNFSFYISRFSEVFFVDASTVETTTADLRSIALAKGIGDSEYDALNWLSKQCKEWLLLFDNADDTMLNLRNYFPRCSHSNILITSRDHEILHHTTGPQSNCEISGLKDIEARRLLLEIVDLGDEEHADENEMLASTIVKVHTVFTFLGWHCP